MSKQKVEQMMQNKTKKRRKIKRKKGRKHLNCHQRFTSQRVSSVIVLVTLCPVCVIQSLAGPVYSFVFVCCASSTLVADADTASEAETEVPAD